MVCPAWYPDPEKHKHKKVHTLKGTMLIIAVTIVLYLAADRPLYSKVAFPDTGSWQAAELRLNRA